MTKEQLQERLELLKKDRDTTKANLLAYEGAIIECQHWLDQVTKTEE